MTPFELWQAGGPEPIVVAEDRIRLLDWGACRLWPPYHLYGSGILHDQEEQAAAEECRKALAEALFGISAAGWKPWPPPSTFTGRLESTLLPVWRPQRSYAHREEKSEEQP